MTKAYGTEFGAAEGKGIETLGTPAGATKEAGAEALFRPVGGFRRYLSNIGAVMWKDILSEYRAREVVVTMIVFALLVIVMFNFAFELGERWKASVGSGILWTAILFSSVLGMNRTFALEKEGECIQGLLLSPADRSAIFLGKLAANLIFLLILEAVNLPVFAILYDFPLDVVILGLGPVVFLATVGLAVVGTLFASIAVNTKAREVMLPLLLFPVAVPVIMGAAGVTTQILSGEAGEAQGIWYRVLAVYDVVFLVVSVWVVDYVLEE